MKPVKLDFVNHTLRNYVSKLFEVAWYDINPRLQSRSCTSAAQAFAQAFQHRGARALYLRTLRRQIEYYFSDCWWVAATQTSVSVHYCLYCSDDSRPAAGQESEARLDNLTCVFKVWTLCTRYMVCNIYCIHTYIYIHTVDNQLWSHRKIHCNLSRSCRFLKICYILSNTFNTISLLVCFVEMSWFGM